MIKISGRNDSYQETNKGHNYRHQVRKENHKQLSVVNK